MEWKELSDEERRSARASLSDFNSFSCLPRPIAASQLNSNQWKSLIIPTSCNAVELISVPVVRPYNANFKSFGQKDQWWRMQDIKHRLMRCHTVQALRGNRVAGHQVNLFCCTVSTIMLLSFKYVFHVWPWVSYLSFITKNKKCKLTPQYFYAGQQQCKIIVTKPRGLVFWGLKFVKALRKHATVYRSPKLTKCIER